MIERFYYLHSNFKILFFLIFCCVSLLIALIISVFPDYQQYKSTQREKSQLITKYQDGLANLNQYHSLMKRLQMANSQFGSQQLLKKMTLPSIILMITRLIKSQHLILINLSPQKEKIFAFTLKGSEPDFFSFLQLMIRQFHLIDIQKMEIKFDQQNINVHAVIAVYYVDN